MYTVRSDDGPEYVCDYTDMPSEGFRTLDIGCRVRFVPTGRRATYVVRLDVPSARSLLGLGD